MRITKAVRWLSRAGWCRRTATALLLTGPLLSGAGPEVFALNAAGLAVGALLVRRLRPADSRPRMPGQDKHEGGTR